MFKKKVSASRGGRLLSRRGEGSTGIPSRSRNVERGAREKRNGPGKEKREQFLKMRYSLRADR